MTDFHKTAKSKKLTRRLVNLGWEFHNDIAFWKWAIEQKVVSAEESLGAPFYAHVKRTPSRRYYSDMSFAAVGGLCPELQVHWRYDFEPPSERATEEPESNEGRGRNHDQPA